MPIVRHPEGQKAKTTEIGETLAQMPALVFLLVGSELRIDASAIANVGALYDSGVHQRSRMAGPANGPTRHWL